MKKICIGKYFVDPRSRLRGGWLLAISVAVYWAVSTGIRTAAGMGFAALFSAWNVHAANVHLAPAWAQAVYRWHASAVTVAVCAGVILLSLLMRRLWLGQKPVPGRISQGGIPFAAGAGIAIVFAALFVLADSMRLERPLSEPALSLSQPVMLAVYMLTALAEEMFGKCVIFDGLADRWNRAWAVIITCLLFFMTNGGYAGNVLSGINVLLIGGVCCALYAKKGLWASACFRCGWSFASVFVAGFGATSGAQSVYTLYGVSENLLTGGDAGMIYGLCMTLALAGVLLWLNRSVITVFIRWTRHAFSKRPAAGKQR